MGTSGHFRTTLGIFGLVTITWTLAAVGLHYLEKVVRPEELTIY